VYRSGCRAVILTVFLDLSVTSILRGRRGIRTLGRL